MFERFEEQNWLNMQRTINLGSLCNTSIQNPVRFLRTPPPPLRLPAVSRVKTAVKTTTACSARRRRLSRRLRLRLVIDILYRVCKVFMKCIVVYNKLLRLPAVSRARMAATMTMACSVRRPSFESPTPAQTGNCNRVSRVSRWLIKLKKSAKKN